MSYELTMKVMKPDDGEEEEANPIFTFIFFMLNYTKKCYVELRIREKVGQWTKLWEPAASEIREQTSTLFHIFILSLTVKRQTE